MSEKVTFIGLGVMGYPMAGHLAKAGYNVTVFNRTRYKAQRWLQEYGGRAAATPAEAAENSAFIFACVGRDDDLRQVTTGPEGAFHGMKAGAIFIDHTTASAQLARELAGLAEKHSLAFLDAPVSGGQSGAENGSLTVMVGGTEASFARAKPLMDTYARSVKRLGPVGNGQLTKMVNQICIAGLLQGLAEGLHFAKAAGLDPRAVIEVIAKGAAQSWQMENRYQTMLANNFDFGFAVEWMRKDLAIALTEARGNGACLPVTALVDQFYAEVQAMGGNRWDTSSLIARLEALKRTE
jgi:3-hydroxyisobutyrate dehydrogenase-like beta-hydroxyacid dehydrogenase